jgi:transposase-like protein
MLMGKVRKRYSRDFKLQVLQELESKSLAQVCREHDVSRFLIARWRRAYEKDPDAAFTGKRDLRESEAKIEVYERLLGQMCAENMLLKKALEALKKKSLEGREK